MTSGHDGHDDRRDGRDTRRWARTALATLAVLVAVGAAAACSGSSGDQVAPAGNRRGGPVAEQPTGDNVEAVEPVLVDLLERYDEVVADILADPTVARAGDDPLIQEFVGLYTPDNPAPEAAIDAWAADAEAGRSTRAAETGFPAIASRIDGDIQTVSANEVRFPFCNELRTVTFDEDGNVVEFVPYREQPGEATAVRVEGQWLLQQLTTLDGQAACRVRESTEEPS
jgi:hypothetical protein